MNQDFLLETGDLQRRPGSMREFTREITLAEPMGTVVIALPAQSRIELNGTMESVHDGVLITLQLTGNAVGECVRCLDRVELPIDMRIQELFAYPGTQGELSEDDELLPELIADTANLESVITDAVVLELPFQPWCREDCPGLCPDCGVKLADAEPDHSHEVLDPRWSALAALTEKDEES